MTVVGVLYLTVLLVKELCALAVAFRAFFLAPRGISRINITKYGSWAGKTIPMEVCYTLS